MKHKRIVDLPDGKYITMVSNEPCKHDGDIEAKSNGYVCGRCWGFISCRPSRIHYDVHSDKTFVDLK